VQLNINKTSNHLAPQTIYFKNKRRTRHMALEIKVIAWDRHKIMAGSNWQMGYQPSRSWQLDLQWQYRFASSQTDHTTSHKQTTRTQKLYIIYIVFSIFHFKSFSNSYFLQHNIKFVRLGKTSKIHGQIQKYSADVLTQNIQSVGELRQFYCQQVSVNTEHTISRRTKTVL
jgi:hypothetical protein